MALLGSYPFEHHYGAVDDDVEDPSDGETLVASRPVSPAIVDSFVDFHEALDELGDDRRARSAHCGRSVDVALRVDAQALPDATEHVEGRERRECQRATHMM